MSTETSTAAGFVRAVRAALAEAGDPERALRQQAYMKSALPYRGLSTPEVRALVGRLALEHRFTERVAWEGAVRELWDGATHREEWYAALALLRLRPYREWVDPDLLPLLLHLVRTGVWWDVVDEIAAHLVGQVLARHRDAITADVRDWAVDNSLWVRRTAILAQLRHRAETDAVLLADVIGANREGTAHGSEFFIRKAIGWALREYARTDPDWVRGYVAVQAERLSPLSRREALKHVGSDQTGTSSTAPTA